MRCWTRGSGTAEMASAPAVVIAQPGPRRRASPRAHRLLREAPLLPLAILLLFLLSALLAPIVAPYNPTRVSLSDSFLPPLSHSGANFYLFGTDKLGRDILSRILFGAQVSLIVIVAGICLSSVIGIMLGLLAGYLRGWVETLIMRAVDVMLSTPTILLALIFSVIWGPSLLNLLLVIILTFWSIYTRQAQAETLSVKERDYVLAVRALGASNLRILLFHVLPNLANSLVVLATLQVAVVVLTEAALSFLGVGIPPPTPAWGSMIAEGRDVLEKAWWVSAMPGLALSLVILAANLAGDWLRDYLDPTMRNIRSL
jgi:peptide/nickel transport system permease protein